MATPQLSPGVLVREVDLTLSLNPELASRDLVFKQAKTIENLAPEKRKEYEPRLE